MPANAPIPQVQPTTMNDPVINFAKGKFKSTSPILLMFFCIENLLLPAPAPAESGRPVRTNRNGQIAQLQETSDLLGQGLVKKMAGTGGKRTRNQLVDNIPENLPENEMAPPVKAKRQRLNKVSPLSLYVPSVSSTISRLQAQPMLYHLVFPSGLLTTPMNHSEWRPGQIWICLSLIYSKVL